MHFFQPKITFILMLIFELIPNIFRFRTLRSREFGLDQHWLLMVDLEHRENERLNNKTVEEVSLSCNLIFSHSYFLIYVKYERNQES
jgi:hypothetical protein